jgi:hypothetical protein
MIGRGRGRPVIDSLLDSGGVFFMRHSITSLHDGITVIARPVEAPCVFIFATAEFKRHFGWGYFSCASAGEWSLLRLFPFQLLQLHSLLTRLSDMNPRSTCSRQWLASAAR